MRVCARERVCVEGGRGVERSGTCAAAAARSGALSQRSEVEGLKLDVQERGSARCGWLSVAAQTSAPFPSSSTRSISPSTSLRWERPNPGRNRRCSGGARRRARRTGGGPRGACGTARPCAVRRRFAGRAGGPGSASSPIARRSDAPPSLHTNARARTHTHCDLYDICQRCKQTASTVNSRVCICTVGVRSPGLPRRAAGAHRHASSALSENSAALTHMALREDVRALPPRHHAPCVRAHARQSKRARARTLACTRACACQCGRPTPSTVKTAQYRAPRLKNRPRLPAGLAARKARGKWKRGEQVTRRRFGSIWRRGSPS